MSKPISDETVEALTKAFVNAGNPKLWDVLDARNRQNAVDDMRTALEALAGMGFTLLKEPGDA